MEYKKNDRLTVKIEDMGNEGEGIGKADGFTLFVKDAVIGDTVECKLMKVKKNYAYARLEKVLVPSPNRVQPMCPTHRQCGGCQLQALSYEKQLAFKQQKVRNHLIRIGGFAEELIENRMEPIVGMEVETCGNVPSRYRNKAQYPVGMDRNGEPVAGFYAGRTHSIISNTDCQLGVPENEAILNTILEYMRENQVPAYDETTGQGLVRHVLIRKGFSSGEIMVCLVVNRAGWKIGGTVQGKDIFCDKKGRTVQGKSIFYDKNHTEEKIISDEINDPGKKWEPVSENCESIEWLPKQDDLIKELACIPGMTSISVSLNPDNTNVIMGKEVHTLWGRDTISDTIHVRDMQKEGYPFTGQELTFHISPLSFYQVNPVQTEKLYSLALEYAGLTGRETVWDLYCGIGTISLFLAGQAGKVYGVEIVPQAIEDAKENARRNGIANAEFFVGKAEEVLPEFYAKISGKTDSTDVIVVDPPRKGCDAACLETMLKMQPKRIVYVSCDSATLARDLRILCDGGYELQRVRPTDMFPHTVHVETVVLLSRVKD